MVFRGILSWGSVPFVLVGSIASLWVLLQWGVPHEWAVTAAVGVWSGVILVLQRVHPAVPEWRHWGRDLGVDLLHMVFSNGVVTTVIKALLFGGLFAAAAQVSAAVGWSLWPNWLPLIVQLPLALLLVELGTYWLHRLSHEWEPLWRLHALHHSSERLYMFSSSRSHPLHVAMTYVVLAAPLAVLGATPDLLALVAGFTGIFGMLQHANIAARPGVLNYVLSTADLHRWHHSADLDESRSNYGNNLVVWDLVFGTWSLPKDRAVPDAVGLGAPFPTDFGGQLASPFLTRLWRDAEEPAPEHA